MTAQPNDRAVELIEAAIDNATDGCPHDDVDCHCHTCAATAALAAIRDALARGGDDADAIAQAIGMREDVAHGVLEHGILVVTYGGTPRKQIRWRFQTPRREADRA